MLKTISLWSGLGISASVKGNTNALAVVQHKIERKGYYRKKKKRSMKREGWS